MLVLGAVYIFATMFAVSVLVVLAIEAWCDKRRKR